MTVRTCTLTCMLKSIHLARIIHHLLFPHWISMQHKIFNVTVLILVRSFRTSHE